MIFDRLCRQAQGCGPNAAVSWWMMSCYAYYVEDDPILSDGLFDELCATIKKNWKKITHVHKRFIEKEAVGSGFYVKEYPASVVGAVRHLRATQPLGIDLDNTGVVSVNTVGNRPRRGSEPLVLDQEVTEGVPARRARKRRQAKLESRNLEAPTKPKSGYLF